MSDEKATKPVNVDPRWCVRRDNFGRCADPMPHSIQEALRAYFQPIKNEDPQLDFYTMYKREATEYDTEYMRKYNEDLNTTLIFVSFCYPPLDLGTNYTSRPVCSPQSALPSSSTSSQNSSRILPNGPKPTSVQSSSPSTDLFPPTKTPRLPRCGMDLPPRLSRHQTFFMRASSCRYWLRSSRCSGSSG